MRLIRGLHQLAPLPRPSVVTIGNFDGVHLGHQALLARQRELARGEALRVVQIFEPTPRELFDPAGAPPRVQTLRDKLAALACAGVDLVLCLRFDRRLAAMPAADYVRQVLHERLRARAVVVGDDFRFGAGREGDMLLLSRLGRELGIRAEQVPPVLVEGRRVSSTALRALLAAGDLANAEAMLGRPYRISGIVRPGQRLGRRLGMPTANIALRRPMALRRGVWAVRCQVDGGPWREGVANFGIRPSVPGGRQMLEVHVFDANEDYYGRRMSVEFRAFLRPERRFADLKALAGQMRRDAEAARALLARGTSPESRHTEAT